MKTNAMANTELKFPLDHDWIAVIDGELSTNPAVIRFSVEPEVMGMYHAQTGQRMQPESHYCTVADCERYIVAYKEAMATLVCIAVRHLASLYGVSLNGGNN